jgi:hypothetical protein
MVTTHEVLDRIIHLLEADEPRRHRRLGCRCRSRLPAAVRCPRPLAPDATLLSEAC